MARALELLQLVKVPSPERRLKAYPHELSGGLRQRAMIALALSCRPSLLLADEPTTALDATVQIQVLILLRKLQKEFGMGVIFVTHDLGVAAQIADKVAVMYAGRIVEYGNVRDVLMRPTHPYTLGHAGLHHPRRPVARRRDRGDPRQSARHAPAAAGLRLRASLQIRGPGVHGVCAAADRRLSRPPDVLLQGRSPDAGRAAKRDRLSPEKGAPMHKVDIPKWAVDRVIERRGSAHPYADLDPARTALIVVDLQNEFMVDGVAHALCPMAVEIVPNVNRLAAAVRRTGGRVVWIKNTHDPAWLTMYAKMRPEKVAKRIESMSEGSIGHQVYPELDMKPADMVVQKWRFSAFLPESSDLAVRLRAAGCDTVLITGTVTNICCESSARDAMMMNFHTIMVSDGNAALSDEEHNASLDQLLRHVRRRHGHRSPDRLPGAQCRAARSRRLTRGDRYAQKRDAAVGDRPFARAPRQAASAREPRSAQDRADRRRPAERLHGRGGRGRLRAGRGRDRAQREPAGVCRPQHRRQGVLDQAYDRRQQPGLMVGMARTC